MRDRQTERWDGRGGEGEREGEREGGRQRETRRSQRLDRLHRLLRRRREHLDGALERQLAQLAPLAHLELEGVRANLGLAHHRQDGHLVLVGDLDLLADGSAAGVDLRADARRLEPRHRCVAVRPVVVRDGQQPQLRRREPKGEVARRRLDEHAEEPLERPEDGAVQHDRLLAPAVRRHVLEAEPLRQVEVALDRRALPEPPDGVADLDVDLGAVEGAAALVDVVLPPLCAERLAKGARRLVPDLVRADRLVGPRGEHHLVLGEAELCQDGLGQVEHALDLVGELLREAKDVRVVLREAAHAEEAVERARPLVAVDGAKLRPAERQVAVRALLVLVGQHVEGAVHRLDLVLRPLHLHLVKHAVGVKVEVAGRLPQVERRHVRRVEQLVPARRVSLAPKVLHQPPHPRAARVPKDEAAASLLLDGEEAELLAEGAVVPPLRLRLDPPVLRQLLRALPRGAVDALQHRPRLVAPPVRARDRLEVDGVLGQLAGVLDVRAGAEVPPVRLAGLPDVEDGDGRVGVLCDDRVEDLQLVRLVRRLDPRLCLVEAQLLAPERQLEADELVHLLLDAAQVLLRKGLGPVEVVVEALLDPRPDRHARVLVQPLHRHRHDVRRRVPDAEQLLVSVGRQRDRRGRRRSLCYRALVCHSQAAAATAAHGRCCEQARQSRCRTPARASREAASCCGSVEGGRAGQQRRHQKTA
mmetsp:Transcript_20147/g.62912  ORF Transcript_20147/g.62912 Transcript_20147/m.62912 type:complete len:700 (-) Transcript_20147:109-2208(-)